MKKLFVWDFHGVLEKGTENAVLEITNLALKRHGYFRQMTESENEFLFGRRWHEYFSYLMPEIEQEECFNLQTTCFEIQKQPEIISKHMRLNDHAEIVLNAIHNSSHCQILISNTVSEALEMFVKTVNVDHYFPLTHRFGINSHHQKEFTKQDCLNKFLQDNDPFEAIISIGDSPGDMALIHQNTKGIGYLYSHPHKKHRQTECHHKINDLRLVLNELNYEMAH